MDNWYVIQVRTGHEKEIADKCKIIIPHDILIDCFIPEYKTKKKYQGDWHDSTSILFRGYVFLISNQVDELFNHLKLIPDLTKMIGKKKDIIYPLRRSEVELLMKFQNNKHIVDMSIGFIKGDKIIITEGPLKGKEGLIKKIDRHKRIAFLSLNIFNEEKIVKVGLEIISKD